MANPEMLHEKPNFPNLGSTLGKEQEGRRGKKLWKKRGICGDKNKSWDISALAFASEVSRSIICSEAAAAPTSLLAGGIMQIQPQLPGKWVNPTLLSGKGKEKPGGDGRASRKKFLPKKGRR